VGIRDQFGKTEYLDVGIPQEQLKIEGKKNKRDVPVINIYGCCSIRQAQVTKMYDKE
jgi:hypothetical protein